MRPCSSGRQGECYDRRAPRGGGDVGEIEEQTSKKARIYFNRGSFKALRRGRRWVGVLVNT